MGFELLSKIPRIQFIQIDQVIKHLIYLAIQKVAKQNWTAYPKALSLEGKFDGSYKFLTHTSSNWRIVGYSNTSQQKAGIDVMPTKSTSGKPAKQSVKQVKKEKSSTHGLAREAKSLNSEIKSSICEADTQLM